MESRESVLTRAARILGIAGVAAGVAGGVVGGILQSRRDPSAQEHLRLAAKDLKETGVRSATVLGASLEDARVAAQAELEPAVKQTRKRVGKRAASFGEHMKQAVVTGAEQFGENLQDALEKTTGSINEYAEGLSEVNSKKNRKRLKKQAKKGQKELSAKTKEGRLELIKLRKDTRSTSQKRLHELESRARKLEGKARKTLDKQLKPTLEKAAESAKVGAIEARKRLEEEAEELEKRYAKAKPKIDKSAARYTERAAELRQELLHAAERRAHEAEKALQQNTEQARQAALGAGESAKEGGKNFGSLILWLTIAGAIVYAFLLDEEKKRKARELAGSAYHEGKAIYQDVRGENADFSTTDTTTDTNV